MHSSVLLGTFCAIATDNKLSNFSFTSLIDSYVAVVVVVVDVVVAICSVISSDSASILSMANISFTSPASPFKQMLAPISHRFLQFRNHPSEALNSVRFLNFAS